MTSYIISLPLGVLGSYLQNLPEYNVPSFPRSNKSLSLAKIARVAFTAIAFLINGVQTNNPQCNLPPGPYQETCYSIISYIPVNINFKLCNLTVLCPRENPFCWGEDSSRVTNQLVMEDWEGRSLQTFKNCNGYLTLCKTDKCYREGCTDKERRTTIKTGHWGDDIHTRYCTSPE